MKKRTAREVLESNRAFSDLVFSGPEGARLCARWNRLAMRYQKRKAWLRKARKIPDLMAAHERIMRAYRVPEKKAAIEAWFKAWPRFRAQIRRMR